MSELLLSLRTYFKTSYTVIDNNMCRFHYKGSVAVLLAFSMLVTAKQYFGDPIDCVAPKDSVDPHMLDTYCWIHKTFSVESAFRPQDDSDVAYPGVAPHRPNDKLVYHSYYQWVCFVLFLQAAAFYVPRFIWKTVEGSRVRHLSSGLRHPIVKQTDRDDQVNLVVAYLRENKDCHQWYLGAMVLVEVLYLVNVVVQMYTMDVFLGGEFSNYGWEVLKFTEWHWEARYDPMVRVFPRMAKCTFHMFGTSGDIQRLDAVCILPINIINEKIYVFLWFWFVALLFVTSLWLVYRSAIIMLPPLRFRLLKGMAYNFKESSLHDLVLKMSVGDWFIIYQLSQNVDPLHLSLILEGYEQVERPAQDESPDTKKLLSSA